MRTAKVNINGVHAGHLVEIDKNHEYTFSYLQGYSGKPVSLTMPIEVSEFEYGSFPPFFDGLLPEGIQLDGLLKFRKIDKDDYFSQLIAVGGDLVGAVTVEEVL
jgi:serine/threonine-protein kinase HipA